jgi:S1-C subfamily serine protease
MAAVSSVGARTLGALLLAVVAAGCGSSNGTSPPAVPVAVSQSPSLAAAIASPPSPSASTSPSAPSAGSSTAVSLQQAFESIVQDVGPSVVLIETPEGLGSGVVLDSNGDIVTNAHVAGTSRAFHVVTAEGTRLNATLVGTFPSDDIAVIKAEGGNLKPATFANSDQLKVGQIVLAIGNPLGLQSSVTDGIVSAVGRTVNEEGGVALPGVIQTSAPINPGNSGGALVDLDGAVVGIPTLTATDPQIGGAAVGIGFAIPSNIARDIGTQLVQNGKVVNSHRAFLGVRLANVMGADGVLVYSVEAGGPAAKAGIPSDVLITKLDDQPTPDQPTLAAILAGLEPGQTVSVTIERRDGTTETKPVTLGELPG